MLLISFLFDMYLIDHSLHEYEAGPYLAVQFKIADSSRSRSCLAFLQPKSKRVGSLNWEILHIDSTSAC